MKRASECWEWSGSKQRGYGVIYSRGRQVFAHRYVYAEFVDDIPDGFHIHHECGNRSCVNPSHLHAVSNSDHGRAHGGPLNAKLKKQQTHCCHGHEFTDDNTHVSPNGTRSCNRCALERWRRKQASK